MHNILYRCQNGFQPYYGGFERNFVLQQRIDEARCGRLDTCIAFLDFANAFGSVPHNALTDAVLGAGTGDIFADIIREIYTDNSTIVISGSGATEPIPIKSGIRQRCPLSGLLFHIAIDPIIRAVQGGGGRHNILAYADPHSR